MSDDPTDDIAAWADLMYPNATIDWRTEYARLVGAVEQALPALRDGKHPGKAATGALATAVECGRHLLARGEPQT